ncbi:unnamed protein product [Polarella glacialis]|uniref:Uncharacterized protein n=1 Tax=Polarella glacialis TaxID=89957 RepID=A0A813LF27_POLGL|nr:unnamed protein product [Polarella glacialis]
MNLRVNHKTPQHAVQRIRELRRNLQLDAEEQVALRQIKAECFDDRRDWNSNVFRDLHGVAVQMDLTTCSQDSEVPPTFCDLLSPILDWNLEQDVLVERDVSKCKLRLPSSSGESLGNMLRRKAGGKVAYGIVILVKTITNDEPMTTRSKSHYFRPKALVERVHMVVYYIDSSAGCVFIDPQNAPGRRVQADLAGLVGPSWNMDRVWYVPLFGGGGWEVTGGERAATSAAAVASGSAWEGLHMRRTRRLQSCLLSSLRWRGPQQQVS